MLPALTGRQRGIYDFILKAIREKGFAPSIPEIGRKFKIASTNGVSDHLKALEKKGDRLRRPNPRLEPTGLRPAAQPRTPLAIYQIGTLPVLMYIEHRFRKEVSP